MKKLRCEWLVLLLPLVVAGCGTGLGGAASDVGLAGTGGVLGYKLSGDKVGGAAIGAATGYVASKIAQASYKHSTDAAEQAGFDRAMNQSVKQQYWIIQNQQKTMQPADERDPRLVPVVLPESRVNGAIVQAHVEYLRIDP
jgi:hypothetical protein